MKVISAWITIFGMLLVVVIGCGSNDNPLREDAQNPSAKAPITEFPPVRSVDQIIGTWLLYFALPRIACFQASGP